MMPFRWRDNLSLGVPAVDKDHRHLMALLNRLHYSMLGGDDRTAIGGVLDELVDYTRTHFRREEMLMRRSGYPDYAAHCRLHEVLTAQVASQQSRFHCDPQAFDVGRFYRFLGDWLTMHILGEDMKLKPWIEKLEGSQAA
ncbi:MAG: bacteriohemerythrin [Rhodospirillales bacterium]